MSSAAWRGVKKNSGDDDDRQRLSEHSAELVADYEQLRGDALEATREHALPPGRALFQRQGMAGWMRVWRSCLDKPGAPPGPAPSASPPLSGGLRAEFAMLLAGMILGQRQECTP